MEKTTQTQLAGHILAFQKALKQNPRQVWNPHREKDAPKERSYTEAIKQFNTVAKVDANGNSNVKAEQHEYPPKKLSAQQQYPSTKGLLQ